MRVARLPTAPGTGAEEAARRGLVSTLDALLQPGGGYEFILLRETPLDEGCVDRGDIDLLATRSGVDAFLRRLSDVCAERGQSFRVRRSRDDKTQVWLLSADLRHQIVFDLRTDLWQVFGGRQCLRFHDVRHLRPSGGTSILRLPLDVEWAIYGQHLSVKRKDLDSAGVQERLRFYATALEEQGRPDLADAARAIARTGLLGESEVDLFESDLTRVLPRSFFARGRARRWSHALRSLVAPRLRSRPLRRVTAVVGVDGVGKTTIAAALAARDESRRCVRGKLLYRESRLFRTLYAMFAIQPRAPASNRRVRLPRLARRDRIDDLLAPVAFLIATLRARRRLRLGGAVLVDKYLPDFLYVNRKTDGPRFSRLARPLTPLHRPARVIHLSVPYPVLQGRKGEITAAGVRRYDEDMRAFYCGASWVDYLQFSNHVPADEAVAALESRLFSKTVA